MRRLAPGLLILLSLLGMAMARADTPAAARQELRAAVRLSLDWIRQHPAGPADGGLADMIDEGVSLRVFQALAPEPAQGGEFEARFRDRMARLERLSQFRQWVERPHKTLIEHYHLVLAAWLMQQAGTHSPLAASIARQAQQAVSTATHEHPTVRLTTALFLGRLKPAAQPDLQPLLAHSLTAQLGRNRQLIALPPADGTARQGRAATWLLYALLHEVVAATDFGRLAPPSWLSARRDTLTAVLLQAVPWASAQRNWDLAAELLMALYFLGEPPTPETRAALDQLLDNQQPDGSWGASPTTARSNRVRHTVLTATAALMAWSKRADDRNPDRMPPRAPSPDDGRPSPSGSIDATQGFWRAP